MLGKDPKQVLLPKTEPLRSMVMAAAERLGLDECCGQLALPGDIQPPDTAVSVTGGDIWYGEGRTGGGGGGQRLGRELLLRLPGAIVSHLCCLSKQFGCTALWHSR
jgi:hypothetical protein